MNKPVGRTSHSCTVYKNRYLVIIGGEGEIIPSATPITNKPVGEMVFKV